LSDARPDEDAPRFLPEGVTGPFVPVTEWELDMLNSLLSDEFDSAFTSSIRCCDGCFDDFSARWPGTALRNMEFQKGAMMVDLAVSQSRLLGPYSPAEISTLKHFVRCPRCLDYVRGWIWIHEHAAADALESEIEGLGALARTTPFLILDDPFARRVLEEIRTRGAATPAAPLPRPLYRARALAQIGLGPAHRVPIGAFGAPPAELVAEGRFNHAGLPMLYLADSVATTIAEVGMTGDEYYVAALEVTGDYKMLDLVVAEPDEPEWELLGAIAASALVAAPRRGTGWVRKEYIFTRFVADCAIDAGFDCIRYGSTKSDVGLNYVLLRPPADIATVAALACITLISA
jgi:hypothetical protein